MRTRRLILLVLPVTLALLGAACLISTTVVAADFTGHVVGVLDGDTINVLHNGHVDRICLSGIDCPEKRQAYGQKAKQAASALAFGKDVTIQTHGHDKYTRTLGEVILPDGTNTQSGTRQARLVVVSEIRARGYSAGGAREGSARGAERFVG